ncbi:hypothetical protein HDU98_006505 [Podochytrium sp. JEL0797]|nr:hypothetical protein HDU98_006505 [Podochytrium sp. JEL0797]
MYTIAQDMKKWPDHRTIDAVPMFIMYAIGAYVRSKVCANLDTSISACREILESGWQDSKRYQSEMIGMAIHVPVPVAMFHELLGLIENQAGNHAESVAAYQRALGKHRQSLERYVADANVAKQHQTEDSIRKVSAAMIKSAHAILNHSLVDQCYHSGVAFTRLTEEQRLSFRLDYANMLVDRIGSCFKSLQQSPTRPTTPPFLSVHADLCIGIQKHCDSLEQVYNVVIQESKESNHFYFWHSAVLNRMYLCASQPINEERAVECAKLILRMHPCCHANGVLCPRARFANRVVNPDQGGTILKADVVECNAPCEKEWGRYRLEK